ncbi:MAG: hypothetical protein HZC51_13315 [Nitrospirae bacterium]|nr:hypothetical protein [Nitrospirota bacterium]
MDKVKVALLWDESFLWGLMALNSFMSLGVSTEVVLASEVKEGALDGCDVLFVPGGWASDKTRRLGPDGAEAVREFVKSGGSYMGFCGGAGLALDVEGGLALTHVSRVPTAHRVPSFSGGMDLKPADKSHPLWKGVRQPYMFHAWWPGQFHMGDGEGIEVVATYAGPGKDFCLADLPASDVALYDDGWGRWEEAYGINLDPARLAGEPAIIETKYGAGQVFLSYLHLETPGDRKGNRALVNAVEYLRPAGRRAKARTSPARKTYPVSDDAVKASAELFAVARDFILFGERNFLWYWRNGWMLQWRRGVRGVEYAMLYTMIKELAGNLKAAREYPAPELSARVVELRDRALPFFEGAKALLLKERFALMNGRMSSISSSDPEVERLRLRLFSKSKRFGGEFKEILDLLDAAVLGTLR